MKFSYHCNCKYETTYEVDRSCKPPKIIKCSHCGKNVRYTGDDLEEPENSDSIIDSDVVIVPKIVKKMKFKFKKKTEKTFESKKIKTSNIKRKSKKSNK